ncbi:MULTISPECIES: 3-methyl-2-oxobutanoate hydroxymethyltransferase [Thermodesulfovibrio]|jgi:3-methyl-2-oxobutanoate hydroxymethyltransferase|uniref:3-methyl-2-oxobutanoate hydroxymethyltransferase n=1 Tax=Thermodesulfovibrio TaxID=28261 RepID=UPI00262B70AE|nr:3-methyl-2-oxobutanoate hydroxymethyltransferase [Thermodesulfovibrio sp.]
MRFTVTDLLAKKREKQKITMLTAYDYPFAQIVDEAGIDMILVGDSLSMVIQGNDTTLPVTVDEIIYHTKIVARATKRAMVVADMPFMSYQISVEDAVRNAGRLVKEAGAQAVKLEGGREIIRQIKAITEAEIPVIGHLGLTPQAVLRMGGYKLQGKIPEQAQRIKEDAILLQEAGVVAIVLEVIPAELAKDITESLEIPTIGIGAGVHCDGQVLVVHDLLGLFEKFTPKFVKKYANLREEILKAIKQYKEEVEKGEFPDKEHSF